MAHISIMRFDVESFRYKSFQSLNSDYIPRIGEKIVLKEDGFSIVTEVFDIHHNLEAEGVDVYVAEHGNYEEYKLGMIL